MNLKNSRSEKMHLFRAYDIRGTYPEDIDAQFYLEIGASVALFAKKKLNKTPHFYVGFDIRTTSSMFAYSLAVGMTSSGALVSFSGTPYPFGVNLFSGLHHNADVTAFVTASHLPPEWNGVKFYYSDGVGFSEEDNVSISDIDLNEKYFELQKNLTWRNFNQIRIIHHFNEYKDFLKRNFSLNKQLKIVIDCGNGSASLSAPEILRSCGYKVIELWCDVDPEFPNRSPEPDETSLTTLSKRVVETSADFGIGFDADGDRGVIVDNSGNILQPEYTGIIITNYLIKKEKKSKTDKKSLILANVECSSIIEKTLSSTVDIKRVKVGHTYLTLEAKNLGALMGMESSGHFVFPEYFLFDDALLLPLITGKLIESFNSNLNTLCESLPKLHKAKTTIKVDDKIKFSVINTFTATLKSKISDNIDTVDGIGIQFENAWVLIRASNTSPLVRITTEAETNTEAEKLLERFSGLFNEELNKTLRK